MATKTSLLGLTKPAYTEAADIAVLNTNFDLIDKAAGNGKHAQNLLNNSWFGIPAAQAGQNGKHGTIKYVCDRWISWDADATFSGGYMTPGSPVDQRLDPNVISLYRTYTAAICLSDGTINAASGTFSTGIGSYNIGIYCPPATSNPYVRLNTGMTIKWAALYEGAYTADTLPEYVYKGYAAELAECQRYYIKIAAQPVSGWCYNWGRVTMFVPLPVTMRTASPTVNLTSASSNYYIGSTSYATTTLDGCASVVNGVNVYFKHANNVSGQCIMPEFAAEIIDDL